MGCSCGMLHILSPTSPFSQAQRLPGARPSLTYPTPTGWREAPRSSDFLPLDRIPGASVQMCVYVCVCAPNETTLGSPGFTRFLGIRGSLLVNTQT